MIHSHISNANPSDLNRFVQKDEEFFYCLSVSHCIYFIKNEIKTVILCNIVTNEIVFNVNTF